MADHYCSIHGYYSGQGCPDCQGAEEQAQEDRQRALELAQQLAREKQQADWDREERELKRAAAQTYLINNPGDYECSYCLMRSLKRGARRCPICQHDIERDYWDAVYAREEEERRQSELKRAREEEERKQKERAHEEWLRSPEGIASKAKEEADRVAAEAALKAVAEREARLVRVRRKATTAMWFALSGLICCPMAPVGLVLGILALNECKKDNNNSGIERAIAAIVVGAVLSIVVLAYLVLSSMIAAMPHVR